MAANITQDLKDKVDKAYANFDKVVNALIALKQQQQKDPTIKMLSDLNQAVACLIGAFRTLASDNEGKKS